VKKKWRRTFESEELLIKWRKSEELFTKVKKNVRKWRSAFESEELLIKWRIAYKDSEELSTKVKKNSRKWRIVEKVKGGLTNGRKSQKDGQTDQSKRWPQLCDVTWVGLEVREESSIGAIHPTGWRPMTPRSSGGSRCVSLAPSSVEGARPHPAPPLQYQDPIGFQDPIALVWDT